MNRVNCLQHIFPVTLAFPWIDGFFLFKPSIKINISTFHYHVDVLICDFTAIKNKQKQQNNKWLGYTTKIYEVFILRIRAKKSLLFKWKKKILLIIKSDDFITVLL